MLSSRLLITSILCAGMLQAAALNERAPAFILKNLKQQPRKLAAYKGKVVFIDFWASWCAPCQEELPELNRLAADYTPGKLKVLAINVDQDRQAALKSLARLGLQKPALEILMDSRSKVVANYNVESMPASFIVDPQGVIRFVHSGFHPQDPATWRKEIASLIH